MINSEPRNTFGVEIEISEYSVGSVFEDLKTLENRLTQRGHRISHNDGADSDNWDVKADGSCGTEITSPPLTWENLEDLEMMCNYLSDNYNTDQSCGLHVHHEISNLNEKQLRRLLITWAVFDEVIGRMVEPSRLSNDFCRAILNVQTEFDWFGSEVADGEEDAPTGSKVEKLVKSVTPSRKLQDVVEGLDRCVTLNMSEWWNTGRVEIRLHHGTTDFEEISDWCFFTQIFIHIAIMNTPLATLTEIGNKSLVEKYFILLGMFKERLSRPLFERVMDVINRRIRLHNPRIAKRLFNVA